MQRALENMLSQGALKDADALIWDLRDGWGGARPEYLDLFNARGANDAGDRSRWCERIGECEVA
jgi:C-terminal processing protease CtpA/Prc